MLFLYFIYYLHKKITAKLITVISIFIIFTSLFQFFHYSQ
nr:MAG TPA: hypothetical protein [Caudoviricetes sp.]